MRDEWGCVQVEEPVNDVCQYQVGVYYPICPDMWIVLMQRQ